MDLFREKIIRKNPVKSMIILLPFFMVFISEILLISLPGISGILKVGAVAYMILYAIFSFRYHSILLLTILLFLPFFIYGILISFNINAAVTEAIRYLFPVSVLLYSYSIRAHYKLLFKFFIIFVLINDFWQIINYINWFRGVDQWFYSYTPNGGRTYNASSGIIRATGIVAFFGLFGFINLIAFFLTRKYYDGKYKTLLLTIFVISMFLSFSYKTLGTFLLMIFLQLKNKLKFFQIAIPVFLIALIYLRNVLLSMKDSIILRIEQYVVEGDSARAESYRVMFAEMLDFNLFGRGVGSFGGPSSVTYNSPIYIEHNFNWYKTPNLNTTDTFFPHLFVEVGLLGGLAYLLLILTPFLFLRWKGGDFFIVFVIYFALLFDALFSYSLNNIAFLMVSLLFMYPLYYYTKLKNSDNRI